MKLFNHLRAFTLIELLVVIAIIGLIATVVMVSIGGSRQQARIAKTLEFNQSLHNALAIDAVGVWDFDEGSGITARDGSGSNNNGAIINGAAYATDTPYSAAGVLPKGYALDFNGTNQYVDLPVNGFPKDNFTVAMWVKPDTISGVGGFWVRGRNGGSGRVFLERSDTSWRLVENSGGASISGGTAVDGRWTHIAVVINGDASKIYQDGRLVVAGDINQNIDGGGGTQIHFVGREEFAAANYWDGKIDEVRIYSRALTLGEIQKLYVEGAPRHQLAEK